MYKSKLLQIFQKIPKKDYTLLKKFVQSPIHNQQDKVSELCLYLMDVATTKPTKKQATTTGNIWQHPALNRQKVGEYLWQTHPFNLHKLQHIMSYLSKTLQAFISYQDHQEQALSKSLHLLNAYQKRGLNKHFKTQLKKINQELKKKKNATNLDNYFHYKTHELSYQIQNKPILSPFLETVNLPNLDNANQYLDYFYLAQRLKYYCAMLSYQNLTNINYKLDLMPFLLTHLAKNWQNYPPDISIYYYALLMLQNAEKEAYFQQFKHLLHQNAANIPLNDLKDIYALANNYCIKQLNNGAAFYLKELFEFYKIEIAQNILYEEKHLPPLVFKNIVAVGLKSKDADWVENFILEEQHKMPLEFRHNMANYTLAQVYFFKENYQKVVHLLHQVAYDDMFLSLDAKRLLLKTYYELDEIEALFSLMDSFRIFLKRRKNISYHQHHYLNLIKFLQRLIKLSPSDKSKFQKLRTEIKQNAILVDKEWLLEKMETL